MAHCLPFSVSYILLSFLVFSFVSQAIVPPSDTFSYINEGSFGDYVVEYDANYRVLPVATSPFQLCFYNTTPGAYTLALRMGTVRSESLMRWVWEANRGNPVGENATLTFSADGNLVLAHPDGLAAWQTNTANQGVVGFKLLPNGNIVLQDASNVFVWQSFDYPTDTLLMGQRLRFGGVNKLVSRASVTNNVNGAYSLVLEPKTVNMYYKSPLTSKPVLYYTFSEYINAGIWLLEDFDFVGEPEAYEASAYNLFVRAYVYNTSDYSGIGVRRPKYNITLSYMRLTIDGNLLFYSFSEMVDIGGWDILYNWFGRESDPYAQISECQLPERCRKFGLCEESQCIACPLPEGLLGWTRNCAAPKIKSCSPKDFRYYELEGVDHFMSRYTRGDLCKKSECEKKCTGDCKCAGYFYNQDTSRCWIAYDLKTLNKVANSTHLGFIKTSIH